MTLVYLILGMTMIDYLIRIAYYYKEKKDKKTSQDLVNKLAKLYDYFIVDEKKTARSIPPINGECPTAQELESLKW
jgi:hypothetical protein